MRRLVLLLLFFASAATGGDRVVIELAAPLAAGSGLAPGDLISADGGPLDNGELLDHGLGLAQRPLWRVGDGGRSPLHLPPGQLDLLSLPTRDLPALKALIEVRQRGDLATAIAGLREWAAGGTAAEHADALLIAARWHAAGNDWDAADAAIEAALAQDPATATDGLVLFLRLADRRPDRAASLAWADRLVQLRGAQPGLRRAQALLIRGRLRAAQRDVVGSLADADAVLELAPQGLLAGQAMGLRGLGLLRSGQREAAREAMQRSLDALTEHADGSLEQAEAMARLITLDGLAGAADAFARFDAVIALLQERDPGGSLLGTTAFNAHLIAFTRRDYAVAERYATIAKAALESAMPGTLQAQQAQTALAEVQLRRGQLAAAEQTLDAALRAAEHIDPRSYEALSTRLQRALVRQRATHAREALDDIDHVLAVLAGQPPGAPLTRTQLLPDAHLYRSSVKLALGEPEAALADAHVALAARRGAGAAPAALGEALLATAEASRRSGDAATGRTLAEELLALYDQAGVGGQQRAIALLLRARLGRDAGDHAAALRDYAAAQDALEAHRDRVGGDDDIRALWSAQFRDIYIEPLLLRAQRGEAAEAAALDARYRAALLRRLRPERLADPQRWEGEAEPDIGGALASDQALLAFAVGEDAAVAMVYRAGARLPTVTVIAVRREQLRDDVSTLMAFSARGDLGAGGRDAFDAAAGRLHATLLVPLRAHLEGTTRWVISADDSLRSVPWAALPLDDSPQPRRLVETVAIAQAASPAVFALPPAVATGDRVLAIADPFAGPGRSEPGVRQALPSPLPGARREAAELQALYGARASALVGDAATEAAVRSGAARAAILHFAVHAVLDAGDPMRSHLVLAPGDGSANDDGRLHAAEIATALTLPRNLVVLSACDSAIGMDAGGEGLLGLSRAFALAGAAQVVGTLWRVPDEATAQLMRDFHRARDAGQTADVALAIAQRQWLARARSQWSGSRLAAALGLADPLPREADASFYWAGFALEDTHATR